VQTDRHCISFGSNVNSGLTYLDSGVREEFLKQASGIYYRAFDHLRKGYNLENNPFEYFSIISLNNKYLVLQDFLIWQNLLELYEDNVHNETQLLSKILTQIQGLPID
jgi:hypothetical protein